LQGALILARYKLRQ